MLQTLATASKLGQGVNQLLRRYAQSAKRGCLMGNCRTQQALLHEAYKQTT